MEEKKLVIIEWIDSCCSNQYWSLTSNTDELDGICPIAITSVGYVIKETDVFVSVAQNLGEEPSQFCNVITIPKGCIIKIEELTKK